VVYWNTYEKDWAKSEKSLGYVSYYTKNYTLAGRMTYTGEWYGYDAGSTIYNPADFNTIYSSRAKWHNNWKGDFRVWRIQP